MHIESMSDFDGTFEESRVALVVCKCGSEDVTARDWESSCGGYNDTKYICNKCQHKWWMEGADA